MFALSKYKVITLSKDQIGAWWAMGNGRIHFWEAVNNKKMVQIKKGYFFWPMK